MGDASFHPRHGHLLRCPPVWYHPCPWTKVLPMSPDRTKGPANSPVERTAGSHALLTGDVIRTQE